MNTPQPTNRNDGLKAFWNIMFVRLKTIIASVRSMNIFQLTSFLFVIACFLAGAFYVLFRIFNYLTTVEVIGVALMDRIIEMALFVFFIMLLFSNIITSFSTFYNDRELTFLFSLPVKPTSIYFAKLSENCMYASWATMVIALPLIVAYGITTQAQWYYYLISLFSILIYLIIPASLASLLIFFILRIFPRLRTREVIILSLGSILALTYLYIKINNPQLLKIFATENEQELLKFAVNLTTVGGIYVPSTWLSNILRETSRGSGAGVFHLAVLCFTSISAGIVAYFGAKFLYAQSWRLIGEHSRQRKRRSSLLSIYRPGSTKAFLLKDILTFVREPTQWVQLSIFLILLMVYVFSLRRTPIYFSMPFWRTIVSFINFAYIGFVLATLGVRFIYPAVSLERSGIWFICSSPLSFRRIIKIKYISNLVLAIIIIESLLIFSNFFIRTDGRVYVVMPIIAAFFAASIVSINMGFGGKFPQFNEDNPSKIAAGSGGIFAALASITYVAISVILLATPAHHYLSSMFFDRPSNAYMIVASFALFLLFNVATIIVPLRLAVRALERRDF